MAGLIEEGSIPGAVFRNLDYVASDTCFNSSLSLSSKMALADAQTPGGLLICVPEKEAGAIVAELKQRYSTASIIGRVIPRGQYV